MRRRDDEVAEAAELVLRPDKKEEAVREVERRLPPGINVQGREKKEKWGDVTGVHYSSVSAPEPAGENFQNVQKNGILEAFARSLSVIDFGDRNEARRTALNSHYYRVVLLWIYFATMAFGYLARPRFSQRSVFELLLDPIGIILAVLAYFLFLCFDGFLRWLWRWYDDKLVAFADMVIARSTVGLRTITIEESDFVDEDFDLRHEAHSLGDLKHRPTLRRVFIDNVEPIQGPRILLFFIYVIRVLASCFTRVSQGLKTNRHDLVVSVELYAQLLVVKNYSVTDSLDDLYKKLKYHAQQTHHININKYLDMGTQGGVYHDTVLLASMVTQRRNEARRQLLPPGFGRPPLVT